MESPYKPPMKIKTSQVLPSPQSQSETPKYVVPQSQSSLPKIYQPPQRISSYSSQKSDAQPSTPDVSSLNDFPSLSSSNVASPKTPGTKTGGWVQMAKNWADKDEKERQEKILEKERLKNEEEERNKTLPPILHTKFRPPNVNFYSKPLYDYHSDNNDDDEYYINTSSNPLGITRQDWDEN